jgi:thiol-disulfide isomerase/thioredoxin/uncharacterized membrane protein YphA (DoxX/SURF4 family)
MEILLLLTRLFLSAIFLLAGVGKLLDLEGSEKAVREFGAPAELAKTFAVALPFAEIVFAVCLLFVETSWLGAIGALLLLLSFIGGMIWQLAQGRAPDCHCFGAIQSEPVSKKSLIRNVVFATLALFLVAQGRDNQGLDIAGASSGENSFMSIILGLAVVGLLVAVVFYLKKISEQQTQIMRRIEVLELTAHEGGKSIARDDLTHPEDGLPIGAPAPDFVLPDLNGKPVSFEQFLAARKPLLMFFVSPSCAPCAALLPEIETWQKELKDKVNFVFISSGRAKENAEKFGAAEGEFKRVLLQKDNEVSELFYAKWTPTALLVNADGNVASAPAFGDVKIRELVESVKTAAAADDELRFIANGQGKIIGQPLPEFSLPDADGKPFDSKAILGKKTLVAYWSPTCGFCQQMLDELREWDKTKGADEPNLLLVSSGEAETNRAFELNSPVVLDEKREIAEKLGMEGTPSAVLVDENGRIVSQVAAGAPRIWALLGKRK